MNLDKRSCLARATKLLEEPTNENLRYASLELRLCIEALTYEKLQMYSDMVPSVVLETWQPPQLVKALLAFEPDSDKSFVLRVGRQDEVGKPSTKMKTLGEHKSLSHKWLRKHYHKLGYQLHAPTKASSAQTSSANSLLAYLSEIAADLTGPVSNHLLGARFRETFSFDCVCCNNRVVGNTKTIISTEKALCFNPQCGAEYFADLTDIANPKFQLMVTEFECTAVECGGVMVHENRKLELGTILICPDCSLKHKIMERHWAYGAHAS